MTDSGSRPKRSSKAVIYLESSDSDVDLPLEENQLSLKSNSNNEEVSSDENIKETKKRPSKGSRNTEAKKLKSNIVKEKKPSKWPALKASVFTINNIVSTKPKIVEAVWKHDLMRPLKDPIDYFKYIFSGPVVDGIVSSTNTKMYGTLNKTGFTITELHKYIGIDIY